MIEMQTETLQLPGKSMQRKPGDAQTPLMPCNVMLVCKNTLYRRLLFISCRRSFVKQECPLFLSYPREETAGPWATFDAGSVDKAEVLPLPRTEESVLRNGFVRASSPIAALTEN